MIKYIADANLIMQVWIFKFWSVGKFTHKPHKNNICITNFGSRVTTLYYLTLFQHKNNKMIV